MEVDGVLAAEAGSNGGSLLLVLVPLAVVGGVATLMLGLATVVVLLVRMSRSR
jgi:hypothetical protein